MRASVLVATCALLLGLAAAMENNQGSPHRSEPSSAAASSSSPSSSTPSSSTASSSTGRGIDKAAALRGLSQMPAKEVKRFGGLQRLRHMTVEDVRRQAEEVRRKQAEERQAEQTHMAAIARLKHINAELLSTEETYVSGLNQGCKLLHDEATRAILTNKALSEPGRRAMRATLELQCHLATRHEQLLHNLRQHADQEPAAFVPAIVQLVVHAVEAQRENYIQYHVLFDQPVKIAEEDKAFSEAYDSIGFNVQSIIVVQRLPRYELLLGSLVTPVTRAKLTEFVPLIEEAVQRIQALASAVDAAILAERETKTTQETEAKSRKSSKRRTDRKRK